jgi:prophage regulatory protein
MDILRLKAVQKRSGLARSTIYERISKNLFPRPISLGGREVGWLSTEVDAWVEEQVRQSRHREGSEKVRP